MCLSEIWRWPVDQGYILPHLYRLCKSRHARRRGDLDGESDTQSSRASRRIHHRITKRNRRSFKGRCFRHQGGQRGWQSSINRRGSRQSVPHTARFLFETVAEVVALKEGGRIRKGAPMSARISLTSPAELPNLTCLRSRTS